ncbi:hypothetical protein [Thalassobacillus hwangdonensis]|uniref:DUF4129 domain-containing protein n=1 Tax=Thalassobacillus hwangdonensis TaxID=546108 RepID=A0ABW3L3M3_9BACI
MNEGKTGIVKGYHYLGDALLFYYLIVAIYAFQGGYPFLPYLGVVFLSYLAFALGTSKTSTYMPFIFLAPLLMIVMFLLGFPIYLALGIPVLLSWRFLIHEKDPDRSNETFILFFSLFVAMIEFFLLETSTVVWMWSIQFTVVVLGHLASNYMKLSKKERSDGAGVIAGWTAGLALLAVAVALLDDLFRSIISMIYQVILAGVLLLIDGFMYVVNVLGLDFRINLEPPPEQGNETEGGFGEMNEEGMMFDGQDNDSEKLVEMVNSTVFWTTITIILVAMIIGAFIVYKLRKYRNVPSDKHEGVSYEYAEYPDGPRRSLWKQWQNKPDDPVRKKFFELEQYAAKKKMGRQLYESIEDWFARLGIASAGAEIYQVVRYGEQTLSEKETQQAYTQIEQLKQEIKQKASKKKNTNQ